MPTENASPGRLRNIHPGEVLREEFLIPNGRTLDELIEEFAEVDGLPRRLVREFANGQRSVTPDIAASLAGYFGTSAEFWLGLQADYDAEQARRGQGEGGGNERT